MVDAGDCDAPYMSPLWYNGHIVGETTSGAWGYRVNHSIALGMLQTDLAVPGTQIEVEIFGSLYKATVQNDKPLWDAENDRLRA
jgi:dimethylglycine dehydrogenase